MINEFETSKNQKQLCKKANADRKLYSIGQVADMLDIPIRTIRYYEKVELVHPFHIDIETNYRFYSMEEIFQLDLIRCLGRELGMPLKKIREFLEMQQEPRTLIRYLLEQADKVDEEISLLLARKNFLLRKLQAVSMREITREMKPGISNRDERRIFVKAMYMEDDEDVILTLRKIMNEAGNRYDITPYLLRSVGFRDKKNDESSPDLIGIDVDVNPSFTELVLPAGKYAEIIYENQLEKRDAALDLLADFISNAGFIPKWKLIFSSSLLDAASGRSGDYYFKAEILLQSATPTD
jgi:DNA-binding transcriptional MerR regulator